MKPTFTEVVSFIREVGINIACEKEVFTTRPHFLWSVFQKMWKPNIWAEIFGFVLNLRAQFMNSLFRAATIKFTGEKC